MVHQRRFRGFTLVELMIVVVILGVLAAVAIAAFTRYVRRTKTAEATVNIQGIYLGQVSYYDYSGDRFEESHFISIPDPTPDEPPSSAKYAANIARWTSRADWAALGFSIGTARYYAYKVDTSAGEVAASLGPGDDFTVRAIGNLDGDDAQSTLSTAGIIAESGEPLEIVDELE